jgi:hypothetical protein
MIGVEVGHKSHFQVAGLDCRYIFVERGGLSSAQDAWSKIDQIRLSPTTIAVAGPERSGSGTGVPVPRSTTFAWVDRSFGAWLAVCCELAAIATNVKAATYIIRVRFITSSIVETATVPDG